MIIADDPNVVDYTQANFISNLCVLYYHAKEVVDRIDVSLLQAANNNLRVETALKTYYGVCDKILYFYYKGYIDKNDFNGLFRRDLLTLQHSTVRDYKVFENVNKFLDQNAEESE